MEAVETCDVAIIGAGPVGLAAAIELSRHGVKCVVIEKNERVGHAPRAKTCNVRTCEHLRRWGIVQALRDRAPFGVDYPSTIQFATRLAGKPLAHFDNAFYCRPGRHPLYAEHAQWTPQYKLEETLLDHVRTRPEVEIRFNTSLESFEQAHDSVTLTLHSAHAGGQTLRSSYVIGADGAGSTTRAALSIRMSGKGALSKNRMLIFRQPGLAAMHNLKPAVAYWLVNADAPCVMGPMDDNDRWYFSFVPSTDDQDPVDALRRATALDIDPEILNAGDWTAYQLIAESYRSQRVFLAGDACHLHPPFGGYGMNLGIGDAVDLGWKMAAVLNGWGGDTLLDSYEIERRPVHLRVIEEAVINHASSSQSLLVDKLEENSATGDRIRSEVGDRILAAKEREFDTLGVVLGYRYEGSPVIVEDGSPPPTVHFRDYEPTARPGSRAPHVWLDENDVRGSALFDRFGDGLTLLVTDRSLPAVVRIEDIALRRGVPFKTVRVDDARVSRLYDAPLILIRPDQHVAWRGKELPTDLDALLDHVLGFQQPLRDPVLNS
ncbi:FAD-dependent oxidoreductase [Caballeronia sp. 15711]|uniref:FAD-dependent oxidoreductase n=1 Tax=Caballeronia sp. 15711 TaxID=3391029 RepID=UPI0039E41673